MSTAPGPRRRPIPWRCCARPARCFSSLQAEPFDTVAAILNDAALKTVDAKHKARLAELIQAYTESVSDGVRPAGALNRHVTCGSRRRSPCPPRRRSWRRPLRSPGPSRSSPRGCSVTSSASDFLPSPSASPSNRSNTLTPAISFLSAARAALTTSPAATSLSSTKAKSRRTGSRSAASSGARAAPSALRRQRAEEHLERGDGARDIERAQRLGVQLAEMGQHDLGTEPQRGGAAGMEPCRRIARQLRLGGVEAELRQQRHHVGLGIEEARLFGRPGPMASGAREQCGARAHARTRP